MVASSEGHLIAVRFEHVIIDSKIREKMAEVDGRLAYWINDQEEEEEEEEEEE